MRQSVSQAILYKDDGEAVRLEESLPGERAISMLAVSCLGLFLVASWVVVYGGASIVSQVATDYSLQVPESPYFQPAHAELLYGWLPLVIMGSLMLLLSPGIFLVLGLGLARHWSELIILAFGTSFLVHFLWTSAVKLIFGIALNPDLFVVAAGGGGVFAWVILAYRVCRGAKLPWPLAEKHDLRRLYWTMGIPLIMLLALLPVLFWQDLSADGFGTLDSGRSLSTHFLPRWPEAAADGLLGLGIGMIPMAYPVHWFVMLFGLIEAAARLPLLLYVPVLFCLLIQLIEWRSPSMLGFAEEVVLFLALGAYTVTMSYNASYDLYFADVASPAAFEALTIVCMLATVYFLWNGQNFWFFFFALMSYLCRPTGLLVLGLLGLGILFCASERRRPWLVRITVAIGACVLIGFIYEKLYIPWIVGDARFGYPSTSILERFRYLRVDDLSRINYALFPGGILPFICLLAFRWQDSLGRMIAILSLTYFAVFYFPAFIALHHFVPAIIFPLVVFWRLYLYQNQRLQRLMLPVAAVAAAVSLWLSLPQHFQLNRAHRIIGQATAYLVSAYNIDYRPIKHANLVLNLIPAGWKVLDPSQELVPSPYSIIYYAMHPKAPDAKINYVIQSLSEPAPLGFTKIAADKDAAVYVKDLQQWHRDRFRDLRTDYRSRLYDIPRSTLFQHWGVSQKQYSIDIKPFIRRLIRNTSRPGPTMPTATE